MCSRSKEEACGYHGASEMIARTHGDEDAADDGRAYGMAVWNGGEARTIEVAKHSNR